MTVNHVPVSMLRIMQRQTFSLIMALAIVVVSGCSRPAEPPKAPTVSEVTLPAGMGSEEPNLSAAPDGRVFLTWLQPADPDGYKLMFSVRNDKGMWAEPKMVAGGTNWFVNDADFPSMTVLSDGTLAAHWLGNNEPGSEAYNINMVFSHDKGATWSKPMVPHSDRKKQEHGEYCSDRECRIVQATAEADVQDDSDGERERDERTWSRIAAVRLRTQLRCERIRDDAHDSPSLPAGRLTIIEHPDGVFGSARMCPRCRSTIQRAIDNPSPAPAGLPVRAASAR